MSHSQQKHFAFSLKSLDYVRMDTGPVMGWAPDKDSLTFNKAD